MVKKKKIVINTDPIISLVAALYDLDVLKTQYEQVLVPFEACKEINEVGIEGFAVKEFKKAEFLKKINKPIKISKYLINSFDIGEASVIQLALNENIATVRIDESVGRRIARLNGLNLTGTIGILIKAKKNGYPFSMKEAIERLKEKGIWLSESVIQFALKFSEDK